MENKDKTRKWLIELGYDSVTEKEDRRTNLVLEQKKKETTKIYLFRSFLQNY
jgi:hypothetical protein